MTFLVTPANAKFNFPYDSNLIGDIKACISLTSPTAHVQHTLPRKLGGIEAMAAHTFLDILRLCGWLSLEHNNFNNYSGTSSLNIKSGLSNINTPSYLFAPLSKPIRHGCVGSSESIALMCWCFPSPLLLHRRTRTLLCSRPRKQARDQNIIPETTTSQTCPNASYLVDTQTYFCLPTPIEDKCKKK